VKELVLNAIDVTGHTEVMNIDLPLDPPASDMTIVSADSVRVIVEFNSAVEVLTFQGVPVSVEGSGIYGEWDIGPSAVSVTAERAVASTGPFDPNNPPFELYVDVTNVVSRRLMLPILVRSVPDGMRVLRVDPEQVTVNAVIR
jgi:hypothetical protein